MLSSFIGALLTYRFFAPYLNIKKREPIWVSYVQLLDKTQRYSTYLLKRIISKNYIIKIIYYII